jgi:predicted RNA binding protein YcfA (HicA-like mRNA interferase family)
MATKPKLVLERDSKKIMRRLEREGWQLVKSEGSHHKLRHPKFKHPIILPHPKKNLPTGTVRQIYKAAGWL